MGKTGKVCGNDHEVDQYAGEALSNLRFFVSVGSSIYPVGYFLGYLTGDSWRQHPGDGDEGHR